MPSLNDRIAVRVTNGWRVFHVYTENGLYVGSHEGFHEEAARRAFVASHGYALDALIAESRKRPD